MNLALFDFDGTITSGDTFTAFLRFAVRPQRIALFAIPYTPVFVLYRLGVVSARHARPIVSRFAFAGESAALVREQGRRYAAEVLPRVLRAEALDRILWHKRQGDRVVVVSASLDVYLDPWCEQTSVERICSELQERNGRLTGAYCGGDCSGPAKVRRIRERYDLTQYAVIYAYGDTADDREMLDLAHRKYYRWQEIREWSDAVNQGLRHPKRVGP